MTTDLRVLFFGDSFVAGTGDPEGRGWVGRVVEASWSAGMPLTPYALGIRRQTSLEVAARWWGEARPRLVEGADCRLVISFGSNDATLEHGRPRVAAEDTARTLEQMLDEAARLRLAAFVVGPPPSCDAAQDARIATLTELLAGVCEQRRAPFVAVSDALVESADWVREARAGDGVHPSAGGYAALARNVLDAGWLDWLRGPGFGPYAADRHDALQ